MISTVQWNKMKHFFMLPPKHLGVPGTEEKLFKAYEEAETNYEKLEIIFHLPIVQVKLIHFNESKLMSISFKPYIIT